MNKDPLRVPSPGDSLDHEDVWQWFQNVADELPLLPLSDEQRHLFESYYHDAGLLKAWRKPFFRHHYALPLMLAVREIFAGNPRPRILDLGCGTGTQSLLFALLGADVIGVDMDAQALEVLHKRKALYERQTGRTLAISTHCGNVFDLDFGALGPFDAVYSLFAFNMMQPTASLVKLLGSHLSNGAVVVIQDGNRSHFFNRVFRSRFASRPALRAMLRDIGLEDICHIGGYAIPPVVWRVIAARALAPADQFLTRFDWLAVSYLHIARRHK